MNQKIDLPRAAEELAIYAAQRLVGFEQQIPGNAYRHPETRNDWIRDILRGMAMVNGEDGEPLVQALDQRLDDAHGCFWVEVLTQTDQKHAVQSLRQYVSALEQLGGDQRGRLMQVKSLLEDMTVYLPWDANAIGIYPARDQVEGQLLCLTAQRPICFTRILLGGERGPWGEDFVSGSVTDMDGVRNTALFDRLTLEYPKVEEWPAICTVYRGGGDALTAVTPADELDLQLMREEGVRFLDRPGISLAAHNELRVSVQEQLSGMSENSDQAANSGAYYALCSSDTSTPEHRLDVSRLSFADEIMEWNGRLNFYVEIDFDPDHAFGTDVCTDQNDDWVNVYANYDMDKEQVCDTLEVNLCRGDGTEKTMLYPLSPAEMEVLHQKMDAFCQAQTGQSLKDYCTQLQAEDMVPPTGPTIG